MYDTWLKKKSQNDFFRQLLNLFGAVAQFLVPLLPLIGIGKNVGAQVASNVVLSPEVPAGYAFSLWFVIFTLAFVYAVYQALPAQRENKLFRTIGWWTASSFLLSSLWMVVVQMVGDVWFLLVIIVAMFFCALKAFDLFLQSQEQQFFFNYAVTSPFLGLFSGWLSLAVLLSIASVIKRSSLHTLGLTHDGFALVILCAAMMVALYVLIRSRGNFWYSSALVWGLAGIVVANFFRPGHLVVCGVAGVFCCLVIFLLVYLRRR